MNRSICIPGVPPVDITQLESLINSEPFQKLHYKKQLGVNFLIFPGAVHTRFEHAIGVLSLTQRLCTIHGLAKEEALHLQAFALLHDIGHGPFSHQTESILTDSNHHLQGIRVIEALADILSAIGIDSQRLIAMMKEEDALGTWVSDRNLGVDKLDYLNRDALHIGLLGVPDIERIQYYTQRTPQGMAIEEKFVEEGKRLQKFYSYLHQFGYLNKTALAAQRMLQRALQERMTQPQPPAPNQIWNMEDQGLIQLLLQYPGTLAEQLTTALKKRQLYKSFLVIKATGYGYIEREADKLLKVHEANRQQLRTFCAKVQSPQELLALEDKLCAQCSLPPGSILFAAMPYFKKLLPKDLLVLSSGRHPDYWLFNMDADHKASLESDYLRTFAVRLICPEHLRAHLATRADELMQTLLG